MQNIGATGGGFDSSEKAEAGGINEDIEYNGRSQSDRGSPRHIMSHIYCLKVFCFFIIISHKYVQVARAKESSHLGRDELPWPMDILHLFSSDGASGKSHEIASDLTETSNAKRESYNQSKWLPESSPTPSSLKDIAARVTEILDRISKKWAIEGAKTIQNGEIRLRKLNKGLIEKIEKLIIDGSKYGRHILGCMNRTIFDISLNKILGDTTECYTKSLVSIEGELKKMEVKERDYLQRMEGYAQKMFDMLSGCFVKDTVANIIDCLQQVNAIDIGSNIRESEAIDTILQITGYINDIPKVFSDCTSKGLRETENHVRKGYTHSLNCLKEHVT